MHVMRSLSLDTSPDAFSLEASFRSPFPSLHILMPCHTSFLNLCQVPVSFLPCYNATSGILHPQSLHVSQCPSNSASLPLPSRANPPGACRGHSDLQCSRSVPLSPGPARKTESTPASDVERDSIQPWTGGRRLGPPGCSFHCWTTAAESEEAAAAPPTASLPQSWGPDPGTWTPAATNISRDWATRAAGVLLRLFFKIN